MTSFKWPEIPNDRSKLWSGHCIHGIVHTLIGLANTWICLKRSGRSSTEDGPYKKCRAFNQLIGSESHENCKLCKVQRTETSTCDLSKWSCTASHALAVSCVHKPHLTAYKATLGFTDRWVEFSVLSVFRLVDIQEIPAANAEGVPWDFYASRNTGKSDLYLFACSQNKDLRGSWSLFQYQSTEPWKGNTIVSFSQIGWWSSHIPKYIW